MPRFGALVIYLCSRKKNYKDKKNIGEENDTDVLRQRPRLCEEEIIQLAKPFDGCRLVEEREELVRDHLSTRCWILNRMFALHITDSEVRRFEEVNEHLFHLSKDMRQRHRALQEQMSALQTLSDKPFELETTLNYYHDSDNPQLHVMEDDAFYGSRWNEMLWTIQYYNRLDAESYWENDIYNLDDGTTWAEGPLRIPQFEHICTCYLVHALCTHIDYSIPDLLRMTTYGYDYQLNTPVDMVLMKI